jgi:hypothetical protein
MLWSWKKMLKPLTTALAGFLLTAGPLRAQPDAVLLPEGSPAVLPAVGATAATAGPSNPSVDPFLKQASGCCGMPPRHDLADYGGNGGQCVPGRTCHPYCDDSPCGRLFGGLYEGLCCPDPCYEPSWIPAANAAFFQDSPRPVTQTRIRWDSVFDYRFPDSAEFFWGKIGTKVLRNPTPSLNYGELSLYQEIAAKGASMFIEMPYYSIEPANNPGSAGFGDINLGVKTVLLDRELLLVSMQFRTFIPSGNFTAGLGTGHVSLEPSLLAALKLTHSTYLQMQLADWIPLGGDSGFEGNVIHYHLSLNQNLWQHGDFLNVIGTVELNGYCFRGEFTDATGAVVGLDGSNYLNAGPGIRVQICDKFDLGVGAAFGFGNGHGPGSIYRTELRIRF